MELIQWIICCVLISVPCFGLSLNSTEDKLTKSKQLCLLQAKVGSVVLPPEIRKFFLDFIEGDLDAYKYAGDKYGEQLILDPQSFDKSIHSEFNGTYSSFFKKLQKNVLKPLLRKYEGLSDKTRLLALTTIGAFRSIYLLKKDVRKTSAFAYLIVSNWPKDNIKELRDAFFKESQPQSSTDYNRSLKISDSLESSEEDGGLI
ncbi:hypothetical protein L596_023182 [Steinernema carpocapsae]|uniref:Uncharacterized protein n=1 Tax=Steinernema carpocapsae TaxID=34508 RepID=A0A4U5MD38_STECR|nr:hypothetical protein L596_023182 [Steinernema carpocapsae]